MNLLAVSGAWVLDIVFFLFVLGGMLIGVWRGFLKCVCSIAGTVFSVIFSLFFCMPLHNSLEDWFQLTTSLTNAIGSATVAGWISIAISFVALVIVVRVGAWLLGKVGTALVNKFKPLAALNRFLGGIFGLMEGLIIQLLLLALCDWINLSIVNEFICASFVPGRIYEWGWFRWAVELPKQLITGGGAAVAIPLRALI